MLEDIDENSREELKRADHLLYVSLKYTRTADVIKNTIKRLISAYNFAIFDALTYLKKKKKIKEIPVVPNLRAEALQKLLPAFKNDIKFYFLLKEIDKAEYSKKEEYRKNVALLAHIGHGEVMEVSTAVLKEYYERTVAFVETIDVMMKK
ncbi:MAG TPA: hypothetical protein VJB94_00540 [Candidatus Nanoarchaeia archaeon]|nr:hypothetical protein [Candidatus Nanoarchaeia archaeon]